MNETGASNDGLVGETVDQPVGRMVDGMRAGGLSRTLRAGQVLCEEDDPGGDVFVIEDGVVDAVIAGPEGEIVVATHQAGAVLGEITAVIGGRRTATLRAREDSRITVVPSEVFTAEMDAQPELARSVLAQARDRAERTRVATHLAASINSSDGAVISQIAELVTWRTLRAGEVLFHAGEPSDGGYLLTAGRLQVHLPEDDRTVDIGRGEVLGESGLMAGLRRSGTVTALRDSTLARLGVDDFKTLLRENTDVAIGLVAQVFARSSGVAPRLERPARLVAMVHLADDPDPQIGAAFLAAMQDVGTTMHLSPRTVQSLLGAPVTNSGADGSFDDVRLTELFHHAEFNHDQILLESQDVGSAWSDRILRQADQIVLVAAAGLSGQSGRRLQEVLERRPAQVPVWLMQVHPERTRQPSGTARLLRSHDLDEVHHVRSGSASDVGRVARLAAGRGVGLVLSGGGARGFAHLGVVRALEESGIPVDRIVGASMGSIVGAILAQHLMAAERVRVLEKQVEGLLDYTIPVVSLIKAERISEVLTNQFGSWDLTDLWTPMSCVSTNLTTSKVMVHRQGQASRAIRASVSIPGVLPPVAHDGDLLVDGGILKNLPVDVMEDDPSISTIIASDVTPPQGPQANDDPGLFVSGWEVLANKLRRRESTHQSLGAVLMRSMLLGSTRDRDAAVASGIIDLYLDLDLRGVGLLEFEVVAPVVDKGYAASRDRIREWAHSPKTSEAASAEAASGSDSIGSNGD